MHNQCHGASQARLVSFLGGPETGNHGHWMPAHFRVDQRTREMPEISNVAHDNDLRGCQSRRNHVHTAAEGSAHSLNRSLGRMITCFGQPEQVLKAWRRLVGGLGALSSVGRRDWPRGVSQHPRLPQPHGSPSGSICTWPNFRRQSRLLRGECRPLAKIPVPNPSEAH